MITRKKFLITAAVDIALLVVALLMGAHPKYAFIGLAIVAFVEYVIATA